MSRIAAALLAFALSGALPLLEAHAGEEGEGHRCHCHHGPDEVCTCTACRRAAARAREEELASLPPCHQAAARAARARQERPAPEPVATMAGCCGSPEQHRATLTSAERYLLPAAPTRLEPGPVRGLEPGASAAPHRDHAPPVPPPRADLR